MIDRKYSRIIFGFIFILSQNKSSNDTLLDSTKESSIFNQTGLCSDIMNNLCMSSLIVRDELVTAANQRIGMLNKNRRFDDRTGTGI